MRAFTLLPLLGSLLFAVAQETSKPDTSISRRNEKLQQFYNHFAKSGDCAIYIDSKVKNDGKTPCKQYCKARGQPEDKIGCVTEHVANGKGPYPTDTDGYEYLPGKCKCAEDIDPIAEAFAIPIIESLAKLDNIICGVFVQAVVEAVNIGFAFVPGGQGVTAARTATKAAVQGAKSFAENAMTPYDFFDGWVKKGCGLEKIELDYQKTFDSLVGAPDSLGTSTGCKRKERGKCKTQPARPDPKTTEKKADPPKTTDKKEDAPKSTPTTSKQDDAAKTTTTKPADAGPNTTAGSDRGLPPGSDKPQATSSGTSASSSAAPSETALTCELCSSSNAKKAARDARWGSMFVARAAGPVCLLDKGPKDDGESCAADGPIRRGVLSERSLTEDNPIARFDGKDHTIDCGKHKPCGEARDDGNIDKFYYLTHDAKCGGDMTFGNARTDAKTIDKKKFQNDHVYEKQTLALFFMWLADGSTTPIGAGRSTKPRPSWVADVLLDDKSSRIHKLPANPGLGIRGNGATVDTVMAYGVARSDPLNTRPDQGGLPLSMTSKNFALVEKDINQYKGSFFKNSQPSNLDESAPRGAVNMDRNWIREHAAVFQYLGYNHGANANKENVWNKWMRVSNWVDLVLHEFDQSYPWGRHQDEPQTQGGGGQSLRAWYAYFIDDYLGGIEDRAQRWAVAAQAAFRRDYSSHNDAASMQWLTKAFGPNGFATAARMNFPRVPGPRGPYGAYGNMAMTLNRAGLQVPLGLPALL